MAMTILTNCAIFNGVDDDLIEGQDIVIENERISALEKTGSGHADANRVDCGGRVVLPGLIDAHFHANTPSFDFYGMDRMPPALLASHAGTLLEGALQRGFTTVRDAAGADVGLWLAIEQGQIDGPRLFYSGKALTQTGGHADMRRRDYIEPCGCAYSGVLSQAVDGVDAVIAAAREEFRKGAHQIKIFVSGGASTDNSPLWMPHFTDEEIAAAVGEAARRRSYVMAHCHTNEGANRCVDLGVRSIEHGSDIEPETAKRIVESGTYVVPTLTAADIIYRHGAELGLPASSLTKVKDLQDKMVKSVETCARAGVRLGLGTDLHGHDHHEAQGRELILRSEITRPVDVLRSATSVNAALLQMQDEIGVVKPGAYADLIAVAGDPTETLSMFDRPREGVHLVMKGGRVVRLDM